MFTNDPKRPRFLSILASLSVLVLGAASAGCSEPDLVAAEADTVDRTIQPISIGDLESINGTYGAGCTSRSGSWSLEISVGATLDSGALSVVKNDTGCELTLTEIHAESLLYVTAEDITLDANYAGSASQFKLSTAAAGGDPVIFFANAKINPDDFSADFTLTFLFSDDANAASGANNADFDQWEAGVAGDPVSAPNYTYDDNIAVSTDVNDVVTTALGSLDFTDGSVTGERYFVDLGTLPATPTYDEIKDVFDAGTTTAISGANPSIPVAEFDLMGEALPVTRTVIIRHLENGVASFQTLKVTFNAP